MSIEPRDREDPLSVDAVDRPDGVLVDVGASDLGDAPLVVFDAGSGLRFLVLSSASLSSEELLLDELDDELEEELEEELDDEDEEESATFLPCARRSALRLAFLFLNTHSNLSRRSSLLASSPRNG